MIIRKVVAFPLLSYRKPQHCYIFASVFSIHYVFEPFMPRCKPVNEILASPLLRSIAVTLKFEVRPPSLELIQDVFMETIHCSKTRFLYAQSNYHFIFVLFLLVLPIIYVTIMPLKSSDPIMKWNTALLLSLSIFRPTVSHDRSDYLTVSCTSLEPIFCNFSLLKNLSSEREQT